VNTVPSLLMGGNVGSRITVDVLSPLSIGLSVLHSI